MPAATATKKVPQNTAVQAQVLKGIKQAQAYTVDAVRTVADLVEPVVGRIPSVGNLAITDKLPTPEAAIDNGFEFVGQLLDTQHSFAKNVLAATRPVRKAAGLK